MTPDLKSLAGVGGLCRLHGHLDHGVADGFGFDFVEWGHYAPHYWRNHLHVHSFHEICLAYAGRGTFTVGAEEHAVTTGDLFLARPGVVHEIIADQQVGLGIAFWGIALDAGPEAEPSASGWWRGLLDRNGPVVSQRLGRIPALLANLAYEADLPQSGHRATVSALGLALTVETSRGFADGVDRLPGDPVDSTPALIALIERYLHDNLDRAITVNDIAAVVHLSARQTARIYATATGESLIAGLRRKRMRRAAHLLLETPLAVTDIAARCGYGEVQPFSTAFRRHYDQTPSSFRRTQGTRHLAVGEG